MNDLAKTGVVIFATLFVDFLVSAIETHSKYEPTDFGIMGSPAFCRCSEFSSCTRREFRPADPSDKQIIVVSDGRKTWLNWRWDVLSTVISSGGADKDLMCYAHKQGKQYGFTARLANFSSFVNGSDLLWISAKMKESRHNFADYVVLDIVETVHEENLNTTRLALFIQEFRHSLKQLSFGTKMLCLLPWTPEMFSDNQTILVSMINSLVKYCDGFMTGSKSYLSYSESCKARPLVPLTKLVLGMDEYASRGIPLEKFFLGVPWHGFDFTCDSYDKDKNICKLPRDDKKKCQYKSSSVQKGLGALQHTYPDKVGRIKDHSWEQFSMAPYFTYNDKNKTHIVYFEDLHSLTLKYHLSKELAMKGVVIWSGDDLNYDAGKGTLSYDNFVWNMLHDIMIKNHPSAYLHDQFKSFPAKMAGVGVGCMLLGTVLGFVIGVIICVRRNKRTLHPPFMKDHPQEYVDEDPGM